MKKLIILLFLCFSSSILAEDIGYKNIYLKKQYQEYKYLNEEPININAIDDLFSSYSIRLHKDSTVKEIILKKDLSKNDSDYNCRDYFFSLNDAILNKYGNILKKQTEQLILNYNSKNYFSNDFSISLNCQNNILSLSFIEQKTLKENYFKKIDINI